MSAASARPGHETVARRLAAIAVPFGIAASPDLTILPVALAASAVGGGAVAGCFPAPVARAPSSQV